MSQHPTHRAGTARPVDDLWTALFPSLGGAAGLLAAVVVMAGLIAVWRGPFLPSSMARADAHVVAQDFETADVLYARIQDFGLTPSLRREALIRRARLAMDELHAPAAARTHLMAALEIGVSTPTDDARLWMRLGDLYQRQLAHPEAALEAYQMARMIGLQGDDLGRLLVATAQAHEALDDQAAAMTAWEDVAALGGRFAGTARLSQAAMLLRQGRLVSALDHFDMVMSMTDDAALRQTARLGVSTIEARLRRYDEALAVLDAAELPDDVYEVRRTQLEELDAAQPF